MSSSSSYALPALLLLAVMTSGSCGGGGSSNPSSPSTPTTRTIGVAGKLDFGDEVVGRTVTATMTITNSGTGALTVSGMTVPLGFTSSWTSGTIAAGGSQSVTIGFAPTASGLYGGTLTVNGEQTSGTNTISMSGIGCFNMVGTWRGSSTITSTGTGENGDNVCTTSWMINSQTGKDFSGTYQASGGTTTPCTRGGTVSGFVYLGSGYVQEDQVLMLVENAIGSSCVSVTSPTSSRGPITNGVFNLVGWDRVDCSGAIFNRVVATSIRKQ